MSERMRLSVIPPAVVFGLALGAWYLSSYVLVDPDLRFLLPAPDAVVRVAFLDPDNLNELMSALALSAQVALAGLVLALVIGLGLAVMMSQSRWLERSLYPYAVVLQTVPILALIPLFGYWCVCSSRCSRSWPTDSSVSARSTLVCMSCSRCTTRAGWSGWSSSSYRRRFPRSSPDCGSRRAHR